VINAGKFWSEKHIFGLKNFGLIIETAKKISNHENKDNNNFSSDGIYGLHIIKNLP